MGGEDFSERRAALLKGLRALLPSESVLSEAETMRPYECDALSAYRQMPSVVCLPESIQQIQAILKLAHDLNIPVVPRGAGTGLSGGALPHEAGLLLGLAKMSAIVDIDFENRCAVVQPGVRNLALSEAVKSHGFYYAPDPSSQIACTIGGNVAENSGGVHCLKYGLTVNNVIGVKLVTMEGNLLEIGGKTLDQAGLDLLAVLCGSEGLLGVIVEITVRLLPIPDETQVVLAAFNHVSKAGDAVSRIIGAGIIPAGLEMMDKLATKAAEDFVHAGYPLDAEAILLVEVDGEAHEVHEQIAKVREILVLSGATEVRIAETAAERNKLWKGRKAAFPAVGRLSPDYYCMDGTIPRRKLAEVLNHVAELSKTYGLAVANVFHAGDGNLHPLILFDANVPGQLEIAEELGGKILEFCVEVGGAITGEHGVGIEKINQMCVQFGSSELTQFHALRAAFEPSGLLNPNKAIPTLHRCAEFGRQHVHAGLLPHPELERF